MFSIKKITLLFIILLLSINSIYAVSTKEISEDLELEEIVEELNQYVDGMDLSDISSSLITGGKVDYSSILDMVKTTIKSTLTPFLKQAIFILVFIVIMAVIKALELEDDSTIAKIVNIVGALVLITVFLDNYTELLKLMQKTISIQSTIVQTVSPFMLSMLILTGAITTTSIIEPILLLLVGVVGFVVNYVVVPLITISVVFNIISNLSDGISLNKIAGMCNKTSLWINAILLSVFLGITSIQTAVSTSVDELAVKTTQTAISGVIPVVGKFVSDSVEFVFGASEIIGRTAGILSLIVIIVITLAPIIKMLISVVLASFVSAFAESMNTDKKIINIIDGFGKTYKTIMGILISTTITFIISIAMMISIIGKILS